MTGDDDFFHSRFLRFGGLLFGSGASGRFGKETVPLFSEERILGDSSGFFTKHVVPAS